MTSARFARRLPDSQRRISAAFDAPLRLPLDASSRYILLSDCHRGTGNANDNFLKNEFLYLAALRRYDQKKFTCIELGDGDELWENRSMRRIREVHPESFQMISRFYEDSRFFSLYGNHDMVKKHPRFCAKKFSAACGADLPEPQPLCPGIRFYSGIILCDNRSGKEICLTHGHQADLLNSTLWRLSRLLVTVLWKPLEKLGIPDPTSAAKNHTRKKKSEKALTQWASENNCLLIAGHTHHPMIGTPDSPYFNTGSCIHPSGITGIEIENRCLTLVKWSIGTRNDMTLYASREVLGNTVCLDDYLMIE